MSPGIVPSLESALGHWENIFFQKQGLVWFHTWVYLSIFQLVYDVHAWNYDYDYDYDYVYVLMFLHISIYDYDRITAFFSVVHVALSPLSIAVFDTTLNLENPTTRLGRRPLGFIFGIHLSDPRRNESQSYPICSMVLVYVPTFALVITQM